METPKYIGWQFSKSILMRKKKQNGDYNVRDFGRFLFGMSPDVPAFKA